MTEDARPHDLAGCRRRDGVGCYPTCGCHCHARRPERVLLSHAERNQLAVAGKILSRLGVDPFVPHDVSEDALAAANQVFDVLEAFDTVERCDCAVHRVD